MVSSKNRTAIIKTLAGLAINLSAGWFGAIIIAPNFDFVLMFSNILILTTDLLLGTFCLWLSFRFERELL